MVVLQSFRTAVGTVGRNPILFVVVAAFSLLQLPALIAQAVLPILGGFISLGFNGLMVFVFPFIFGGLIGMANEGIDGRTEVRTFVREGKRHYVSLLGVYFGLFALSFALNFAVIFAVAVGGAFVFSTDGQSSSLLLAIFVAIGLVVLLGYLLVTFLIQFFAHAIVVDDLRAVDGLKRSVSCVRRNLLAVFGYNLITAATGAIIGLFAALVLIFTSVSLAGPASEMGAPDVGAAPWVMQLPATMPSVGLAGVLVITLVFVLLSGVVGGFFAAYSTAIYRSIRPAGL